jgi:SAM-dependent methyltransferase
VKRLADRILGALATCVELTVARPVVYDAIQAVAGLRHTRRRLAPFVAHLEGDLLDVGGGTGLILPLLPATARYLWLDNDPLKLRGFRLRAGPGARGILGDATRLCLRDASVDLAVCIAVSHHLAPGDLERAVAELARVVRRRLVFLDALDRPSSWVSRVLWRLDRGSFPRSAEALRGVLEQWFEVEHVERYTVYHEYMLWAGRPRRTA